MLGAPDDRTPVLVATVIVAVLVLLSNDAEGVPPIVDVCEYAAGSSASAASAGAAPAVPVGLVVFEGVGNAPSGVAFTGVAVLYTFLRAVERVPKRARALYLRVALAMLAPVYEELLLAVGAQDDERALPNAVYVRAALRSYARLAAHKAAERELAVERCADKLHRILAGMQETDEEDKLAAAMVAVTNVLSTVEIIANENYGA